MVQDWKFWDIWLRASGPSPFHDDNGIIQTDGLLHLFGTSPGDRR